MIGWLEELSKLEVVALSQTVMVRPIRSIRRFGLDDDGRWLKCSD